MDNSYQETYQKIKSGQYYKDAVDWYNIIYIYPHVQRAFFLTITILSVIVSVGGVWSVYTFLPIVAEVPLAVEVEDKSEMYSTIRSLGNKQVPYQDYYVMEYLLTEYIISRESYKYEEVQKNLNFVKTFSTPEIYDYFNNYFNIRNPQSPILRYKQNGVVRVNVSSVSVTLPNLKMVKRSTIKP